MTATWLAQSEADLPGDDVWLTPRERERAARMRFTKRRTDYLLGRWTGKSAVARALGLAGDPASLAAVEVRNADDGAPYVLVAGSRAGLSISLTDRAGWGVCTLHAGGAAVGCDLELVEPRSAAFVADYLTAAERAAVAASGPDRDRTANLLWCAKESAMKVLRTGLRRDTRSVEVRLSSDAPVRGFRALEVRDVEDGGCYPGWWRQFGDFLLTFAADRELPPPTSLVEPPGLESAVPTHSWLGAPVAPKG